MTEVEFIELKALYVQLKDEGVRLETEIREVKHQLVDFIHVQGLKNVLMEHYIDAVKEQKIVLNDQTERLGDISEQITSAKGLLKGIMWLGAGVLSFLSFIIIYREQILAFLHAFLGVN